MLKNITLFKTSRLTLRKFEESDFAALTSMMIDPIVMRFTGFRKPQTLEKIRELLTQWQIEGNGQLGVWAVIDSRSKQFIGWSMLKRTTTDTPELGYMIAKAFWGQGYGTELAEGLLKYGHRTLKLNKITAVTSPENLASIKILEKIGMKRTNLTPREDNGLNYEITF